jgi:hypothetical protein
LFDEVYLFHIFNQIIYHVEDAAVVVELWSLRDALMSLQLVDFSYALSMGISIWKCHYFIDHTNLVA